MTNLKLREKRLIKSNSTIVLEENFLGENLWIYLPKGYFIDSKRRYPVIYMWDAQNLFDLELDDYGCWNIEDLLDNLWDESNAEKAFIVVGMEAHDDRMVSYDPTAMEGIRTLDKLCSIIKPHIDLSYRTLSDRENTYLMGSSLGANMSLIGGLYHQNIFSKIGVFSLAVEDYGDLEFKELEERVRLITKYHDMKIYFDMGITESSSQGYTNLSNDDFIQRSKCIFDTLASKGFYETGEADMLFVLDTKNTEHNQTAWNARFLLALNWLISCPTSGELVIE